MSTFCLEFLTLVSSDKNELQKQTDTIKNQIIEVVCVKVSDTNKEDLEILFQDNMIGYIEFKCSNCNYRKSITETIKLYQMNVKSQYNIFRSIDDNKILAMNPIYPRTKDYNCKNIECITHKDPSIKEAVFFREKDTYELNYICTIFV